MYVDLVWSLFLIKHLYLSYIARCLKGHQEDTCYIKDWFGQCAHNIYTSLRSIVTQNLVIPM